MKKMKIILMSVAVILTWSFNGCGSSDNSTSNFDNAMLMNLADLPNYDLIIDDVSGAKNLRTTSENIKNRDSVTPDNTSIKLSNIIKNTIQYSIQNLEVKKQRDVTINGSTATLTETTNGNISGTETINFKMNISTGKLTGSISYSNYKNSENNVCGENEVDNLNGTMKVAGVFNTSNYDLNSMTIKFNSSFFINDMIWKSGTSLRITYNHDSSYNEDLLMIMTIEATYGNESIGFKDLTIRSYNYNGYEYSYPIEGNIYIFTDDINEYFSVDKTYDHSLTPTKEDWCGKNIYSGTEKYIGKDSTLTWTITSTNHYKVEIDSDNDNIVDINITGVFGE